MDFTFRIRKLENELSGSVGLNAIAIPIAIVLGENADPGTKWIQGSELVFDENLLVERQNDCVKAHNSPRADVGHRAYRRVE